LSAKAFSKFYRKRQRQAWSPHHTILNTKIDIKSTLVGFEVGVLVMLGIAAASSPGSVGRYQIAGAANHGMVLDTATGQVWSTFLSSSGGKAGGDFYRPKTRQKK
jgi:hypothetical protein